MIEKALSCILSILFTFSTVFAGTREADPELVLAARGLGNKYALVIGVEYAGVHELKWTVDDAVEIGWLLEKEYGFDVTCIITRYPKDRERKKKADEINALVGIEYTDKEGIANRLDALEETSDSENDQVLVYFSGHGRAYGDSGKVGYLIPSGGDWQRRTYSLINMRRFDDLAENLKARHALFVVDSCFSGIAGAFSTMDYKNPKTMENHDVKRLMGASARQILTAGETGQKASMDPRERMSAFSFYFKRALETEAGYPRADYTRDGLVTAAELHLYLGAPLKQTWNQDPCFFNFTKNSGQFVFVPKDFETRPLAPSENAIQIARFQSDIEEPGGPVVRELETRAPEMRGAGGVYITAEPEGARALITTPDGGRLEGECPVRLKNLPSGVYKARLTRPMYHPREITLNVGVGISKARVTLRPNFGRLTVTSDPEGADVYLDGVLSGSTPLVEKVKKSGVYALKVQARRRHAFEKNVRISDEELTEVHAGLAPEFGTLDVEIAPGDASGAAILLDEEKVGEAAWDKRRGAAVFRRELMSGAYLLSLRHDWFDPVVNREIVVRDGETTKKSYRLTPIFGTLNVESKPPGATVHVDAKKIGPTPVKELKLNPGEHTITVAKDDSVWMPKPYVVTITSGDSLDLFAELERKTGGVTVDVKPPIGDVHVFLKGEKSPRDTAPCTINNLSAGVHTVICRGKKGGKTLTGSKTVSVEWRKITNVTITLGEDFSRTRLRKKGVKMTRRDVDRMLVKYNFPARLVNKWGHFRNEFKDRGDGTVVDRATGLMWRKYGSDKLLTYHKALEYIDGLNRETFGGHGDWRLPTLEELASLLERKKVNGKLYIDPIFGNRRQWWCWSADKSPRDSAWAVNFNSGAFNEYDTDSINYACAVRSYHIKTQKREIGDGAGDEFPEEGMGADGAKTGHARIHLRGKAKTLSDEDVKRMFDTYNFSNSDLNKAGNFKNDFKNNGDGTVTDRATGLMWQQSGSDAPMVYGKALKYIEKLNREKYAGYDDWRLPTLEELASLMEPDKMNGNLCIDPVFDKKQRRCWSADKSSSGSPWVGSFHDNSVGRLHAFADFSVRAVRSGQ